MNSKERVLTALSHQAPDHAPCNYLGTPETDQMLKEYFATDEMDVVLDKLAVDVRVIDVRYIGPELKKWPDGRFENYWGQIRKPVQNQAGTYYESVEFPYAQFQTVADVEKFRWPSADWFDYSSIRQRGQIYRKYAVVFGATNYMDLINGIAYGRGVERFLFDLATEDPIGMACMEKRFECCYTKAQRSLQAGQGLIDIFWIGDDYGTQNGLLVHPQMWRKLFFPRLKAMCDLGHRYGTKVMLHSCGSTAQIWPDRIEAGVDIYDTVQPEAANMDPGELKRKYGDRICFHGTISTQKTLPFGTPLQIKNEVRHRIQTVGTNGGLILAPAHNIQPDVPVENILAMYEAVAEGSTIGSEN